MWRTVILLAVLLVGVATSVGMACDTPVYRYAMYRWETSPYEVYLFHNEDLSEAETALVSALTEASSQGASRTNLALFEVDLRDEAALEKLSPDVRRRWQEWEDKSSPAFLTVSPHGGLVSWQPLTQENLSQLLNSPTRSKIAADLAAAKATVLVLLSGADALATQAAEQEVQQLVAQLHSGEMKLHRQLTAKGTGAKDFEESQEVVEVGYLKLNRNDPQEQWLVQALLAVEGDLREIDQPMVFPVYGRGRVLPPFVGAGISTKNLAEAVGFLTGACSCTVKDQNPGIDLLMTYDWESAATALKEKFGAEEGNEELSEADLFPQLIIPGETGEGKSPAATSTSPPADVPPVAVAYDNEDHGAPLVDLKNFGEEVPHSATLNESRAVTMRSLESDSSHSAARADTQGETSTPMFLTLGLGVGVGLVLLAVGTFFVFRNE